MEFAYEELFSRGAIQQKWFWIADRQILSNNESYCPWLKFKIILFYIFRTNGYAF